MKQISIIIPAYNEEKSIENTLKVCIPLLENTVSEIIVVNDCSTDNTLEILKTFSEIQIIDNKQNLGKSKSVAKAIESVSEAYFLMLDADLLHLQTSDIEQLLAPIIENKAQTTYGFLKNSWPLFPFKKIDYCTGERVLPKEIFSASVLDTIKKSPSYVLEGIINNLVIQHKLSLQVVSLPNVENRLHTKELGFIQGWKRNFKIWREIQKGAGGFIGMYKVNFELRKLLVAEKNNS